MRAARQASSADAPISRYSLGDGSLGWEKSVPYLLGYPLRLALDTDNSALVTFSSRGNRTFVRKQALTARRAD